MSKSSDKLEGFKAEDTDAEGNKIERAPEVDLEAGGDPSVASDDRVLPQETGEPDDPTAKIKERSFKDGGRDAIAARLSEARKKQQETDRAAIGDEESDQLDEIARGEQARIERMEREARGESDEEVSDETTQADDETDPKRQAPVDAPLASGQRTFTIRVYGKDETISEDEARRLAQLAKAGEIRLEDAATREAQLEEWEGNLRSYAESLRQREAAAKAGSKKSAGAQADPQPPSGAAGQEVAALRKKAGEALLQGDDETYARLSAEADEKLVQIAAARLKPTVEQPDDSTSSEGAVPELPARPQPSRTNRVAVINDTFARDYGDLLADDLTFYAAKALMEESIANPQLATLSPEALVKKVGETIKSQMQARQQQQAQPSQATRQELESRRTLKATIPITRPAGAQRAGGPTPPPKYPSRSEVVQGMRRTRGQA